MHRLAPHGYNDHSPAPGVTRIWAVSREPARGRPNQISSSGTPASFPSTSRGKKSTWWFKVTFLGWWKRDAFKGFSDLQLGDEKGTLNHLVYNAFGIHFWDLSKFDNRNRFTFQFRPNKKYDWPYFQVLWWSSNFYSPWSYHDNDTSKVWDLCEVCREILLENWKFTRKDGGYNPFENIFCQIGSFPARVGVILFYWGFTTQMSKEQCCATPRPLWGMGTVLLASPLQRSPAHGGARQCGDLHQTLVVCERWKMYRKLHLQSAPNEKQASLWVVERWV